MLFLFHHALFASGSGTRRCHLETVVVPAAPRWKFDLLDCAILDLGAGDATLGAEGAHALATALAGRNAISALYLSGNELGLAGAVAISSAVHARLPTVCSAPPRQPCCLRAAGSARDTRDAGYVEQCARRRGGGCNRQGARAKPHALEHPPWPQLCGRCRCTSAGGRGNFAHFPHHPSTHRRTLSVGRVAIPARTRSSVPFTCTHMGWLPNLASKPSHQALIGVAGALTRPFPPYYTHHALAARARALAPSHPRLPVPCCRLRRRGIHLTQYANSSWETARSQFCGSTTT